MCCDRQALSPDGTEAGFGLPHDRRARELGMSESTFMNSNGWPDHEMSVRDLAILAEHLIEDFPEFYPMFSEQEFAFDGCAPSTRAIVIRCCNWISVRMASKQVTPKKRATGL